MSGTDSLESYDEYFDTPNAEGVSEKVESLLEFSLEANPPDNDRQEEFGGLNPEESDEYFNYLASEGLIINDKNARNIDIKNEIIIEPVVSPVLENEFDGDPLIKALNQDDEHQDEIKFVVVEDHSTEIRIDQTLTDKFRQHGQWQITAINGTPYLQTGDWINIQQRNTTPEAVRNNNVVLSTEITNQQNGDWLEIHVHDFRNDGQGLLGLELDLEWNQESMSLDESRYLKDNIFEKESLPLFNNIGVISSQDNIASITGLSAASLPIAMQGKTLGLTVDDDGSTLFARIPIEDKIRLSERNLLLETKKYPAIGGKKIERDHITILDDSVENLLFLNIDARQQNVGKNVIGLVDQLTGVEKSVVVDVLNVNDAPTVISNNMASIRKNEKEEITIDANTFFEDEDNDQLSFQIIPEVEWLQVDEKSGLLRGTPQNEDVGSHSFKIRASDADGLYAEKDIKITIDNVNDKPYIKKIIPKVSTKQDVAFNLKVNDNYFSDIDKANDQNETLTFTLNSGREESTWLQIDSLTGTLSGTPENSDVGEYYYKIKATDRLGESIDQDFNIQVDNINDSPFPTDVFDKIAEVQLKNDNELLESDLKYSFYTNEVKSLDMTSWFDDIDLQVDPNEKLEIDVYYNGKDGEQLKVLPGQNNNNQWISLDEESKILSIMPSVDDIGKKFLLISVEDKSKAILTKVIPIQIRHKNTSPFIDLPPLERWSIGNSGIKSIRYDDKGEIYIDLVQDQNINIDLPISIFADDDLGIVPEEKLTVTQTQQSTLKFNQDRLSFTGSTYDIGLDKDDGLEEWAVNLEVHDHKNKKTNLTIHFSLQRSVDEPLILRNSDNSSVVINEEDKLRLKDIFEIKNDNALNTRTKIQMQFTSDSANINLKSTDPLLNLQNKGNSLWEIDVASDFSDNLFDNVIIEQSSYLQAQEVVELTVATFNYISNTSVNSSIQELKYQIAYNPIAEVPEWTRIETNQKYQNENLGKLLLAGSKDVNEKIIYRLSTPDNSDILITDWSGKSIGIHDGNTIILNTEEWNQATIRSKANANQKIPVVITPISVETSNGLSTYGKEIEVEWYTSSLIDSQAALFSNGVNDIQYSGKTTTIKNQWVHDYEMNSGFVEYQLNRDLQLTHDGIFLTPYKTTENLSTYRVAIQNPNNTNENEVTVYNPLNFNDSINVGVQTYFSQQEDYWKVDEIQKLQDISQKLILKSNNDVISWNLIDIAENPELVIETQDKPINIDTGELLIKARRGQNVEGKRNKDELITINISNIPQGFLLASRSNNQFNPCGATDLFGTVTVFVKDTLISNAGVDNFVDFDDDSIYLVRKHKNVIPDQEINLLINAVSNIPSETRGETRSDTTQLSINIDQASARSLPVLSINLGEIDPIMIDFGGDGLELTNLVDSNEGIQFKMIPSKSSMKTAWLSNEANKIVRNKAAFLVYDEFANENREDFVIHDSSQLFSEYFQSPGGIKKWQSGVAALTSLDSNNDMLINRDDTDWAKIKLWFDDGDGNTDPGEVAHISNFIDSIHLNNITLITDNPSWAAQNSILRSFEAQHKGNIYKMYDVGLVNQPNQNHSAITFEATSNVEVKEGNEIGVLKLSSQESDTWKKLNKDNLTLLRLSGLPPFIKPSIGIQDDLGDWVMTWKSLRDSSETINLIQDSDWSGDATLQIMISQLQDDGTIRSSSLKSLLLSVKSVADPPKFITQDQRVNEDEYVCLENIVQLLESSDNDGSESLGVKVKESVGLTLKERNDSGQLLNTQFGSLINKEDLSNYYLAADNHIHGNFVVNLIACSLDGDDLNESVNSEVNISFTAVADGVNNAMKLSSSLTLVEGVAKPLSKLIDIQQQQKTLIDNDGSESLEVEILLPNDIILSHSSLNNWMPLQATNVANNQRLYVISNSELDQLLINFTSQPGADPPGIQKIQANYLTRELSNGAIHRSAIKSSLISIDYNARAPIILRKTNSSFNEDSQVELFTALATVLPGWKDDLLYIKDISIPPGLLLIKEGSDKIYTGSQNNLEISIRDKWFLKAEQDLSGDFSFQYTIEAKPGYGAGKSFIVSNLNQRIVVEGIPDIPLLEVKKDLVEIKSNGWLTFDSFIELPMQSRDTDGSELNYLEFVIEGGEINDQVNFNQSLTKVGNNMWKVSAENLNTLQVYFGEISSQRTIKLKAFSEENGSVNSSSEHQVVVNANAKLFAPILESSGEKSLQEDTLIPILSTDGGSISVVTQGNISNQQLFLEISRIPAGFTIVEADFAENRTLSRPINISKDGNLTSFIRLPFDKFERMAIKAPNNYFGSFNVSIESAIRDSKGNEKKSNKQELEFTLLALNDAPVIDIDALNYALNEGEIFNLSLDNLVSDVDNISSDLSIELFSPNGQDSQTALPKWLSLTEDNRLIGTPANEDVGDFSIGLLVNDPLGLQSKAIIKIQVGNKNAKPKFNSESEQLSDWTSKLVDESLIYSKSLLIEEELKLDLYDKDSGGLFLDEDILYADKLKFEIRTDSQENWSQSIDKFAQIIDDKLYIKVHSKLLVGSNQLYLKASDLSGENVIQQFDITVVNINAPPIVTIPEAEKISSSTWAKSLSIKEDDSVIVGNMFNVFDDEDPFDSLNIMRPSLPPWIQLLDDGRMLAQPKNIHVGKHRLQWQAIDNEKARANFILDLLIENVNDSPVVDLPEQLNIKQGQILDLDLSQYASDVDDINGDTLAYKIKLFSSSGSPLPQPDWLQLRYRTPEPPSGIDSLLITPTIYRLDARGNEVGQISVDQLDQLNNNQSVRVKVEVYDDRPLEKQGIIGADMTIRLNSNLDIASETIKINEDLPLFNDIQFSNGVIDFAAGSAPDALGIGNAIGFNDNNTLLQFDAVIIDNQSSILIDIESNRDNQDALADRYANKLDSSNSLWHSFATKMDARIHFENAANIDVGNYLISIEVTDTSGQVAKQVTTLNVNNTNDRPFLLQQAVRKLTDTFRDGSLLEGEQRSIESLPLFGDPDWLHGSFVDDSLGIQVKFKDELLDSKFLQLQKVGKGSIDLTLDALAGFTTSVDSTFKIVATDSKGESVNTDWINLIVNPRSHQTLINSGLDNSPLPKLIDNVVTAKNTKIRLFDILNTNLILPDDQQGDEVIVNILVENESAELSFQGTDIGVSKSSEEGNLFSINCLQFASLNDRRIGDLRDLEIILPNNEIQPLIKKNTSSSSRFGIPIKIWTDTKVKEDISGVYGTKSSPIYDIRLELKNNRPIFVPQASVLLDKHEYIDKQPDNLLVNMGLVDDMFFDSDINENLKYYASVPSELSSSVSVFIEDNVLFASIKHDQFEQIQNGIYNIVLEAYDSSGQAGDKVSGLKRGVINLVVKDSESVSKRVLGLIQLQDSNPEKILDIISKSPESLDRDEQEVITILNELQLTPADNAPLSVNQRRNIVSLVNSLAAGESKIMTSNTNDKSLLLLQTTSGNLMEDAFSSNSPDNLSSITQQIEEPNKDYLSPLGRINFTVLTDSKDYDIVSITIPPNETVDKLLKSNENGEYKLFSSEVIAFDGDPLELDDWLDSLTYGVYNYNDDSPSRLFNFSPQINSSVADLFDSRAQYSEFISSSDGSGYLIDTNSDGNVDLINFLILDEGWFDTRKGELSIIGDPLLPLRSIPSDSSSDIGSNLGSDLGSDFDTVVINQPAGVVDTDIPTNVPESVSSSDPNDELSPKVTSESSGEVRFPKLSASSQANARSSKLTPLTDLKSSDESKLDLSASSINNIQRSNPPRSLINEASNDQSLISTNISNEYSSNPDGFADSKLNSKPRPANDIFMSLPKYFPFSNSLEAIIAGVFLLPMGLDRVITFGLSKLKSIPKLLLNKQSRGFNRTWVIPSSAQKEKQIILNCNGSALSFSSVSLLQSEQYEIMPGFTSDGISFLWSSLTPSNVGKSLKAVQSASLDLMTVSRDPKDWIAWIDLLKQDVVDYRDSKKLIYLNRLESIITNVDLNNLNCIDAFMVAQLSDCATRMGLNMANNTELSA